MIHQHRFREQFDTHRLPRPAEWPSLSGSFLWYPIAWLPGQTEEQRFARQRIYQLAFEEAQAVARPSLPERDLLGNWN